ncbi:MAG: hypothetical protein AAFV53_14815 [Myxococcota bacterium]
MRPSLRQVFLSIVTSHTSYESGRPPRRYPDGTAREGAARNRARLEARRARREAERRLSWSDVFLAAVGEAMAAEPDSLALESSLRQVAVIVASWLEDLQARRLRREMSEGPPPAGTVLHVRLPPRSLVYRAVVQPDGRLQIPVLRRDFSIDEVQVQPLKPDASDKPNDSEPLRGVLDHRLDEIKRNTRS